MSIRLTRSLRLAAAAAMIAGCFLPWLTLFAGLTKYVGISGALGWLVCAAGVLLAVDAVRPLPRWLAPIAVLLAAGAVGYSWSGIAGFMAQAGNRMMVPGVGLGLKITAVGVALSLVTLVAMQRAPRMATARA